MSEDYKKLLTKKVLQTTKTFALKNLDNVRSYKEDSEYFFTRVYLESFMDALISEDFELTIDIDNKKILIKKGDM